MFVIFLLVVFVLLWIWNYYKCKEYNQVDPNNYRDPFRFPVPDTTKQFDCDPRQKLIPCFSDVECLNCKDYKLDCNSFDTQTIISFDDQQVLVPKGNYCTSSAISKIKPINCNIHTGRLVVVQTTTGYEFICKCIYPWLLTQKTLHDDCDVEVGCKNGTLNLNEQDPLNSTCSCKEWFRPITDKEKGPSCKPWSIKESLDAGRFDENPVVKTQKVKFNGVVSDRKIISLTDSNPLGYKNNNTTEIRFKTWGRHSDDPNSSLFYTGDAPIYTVWKDYLYGYSYFSFEQPYDEYNEGAALSYSVMAAFDYDSDIKINQAYAKLDPKYHFNYVASTTQFGDGPELENEIKWNATPPLNIEYLLSNLDATQAGAVKCQQRKIPDTLDDLNEFLRFQTVNELFDDLQFTKATLNPDYSIAMYNQCLLKSQDEYQFIPVWRTENMSPEYRYWFKFIESNYTDIKGKTSDSYIIPLGGLQTWLNSTVMKKDIRDYDHSTP